MCAASPLAALPNLGAEVAPLERARAMCALLGLSSKAAEKDLKPASIAAAKAAIRTGEAFLQNAYADAIEGYM